MKTYEKPVAEVVDFTTEKIMDGGLGDGLTTSEDVEL